MTLVRFWPMAVLASALVVVPAAVVFYTDWLWFGETGYQAVFARILSTQSVLVTATI